MINGLLTRIEQELGCKPSIIATGGIFKLLLPYMNHPVIYDGTLLLKGLLELYKKNQS